MYITSICIIILIIFIWFFVKNMWFFCHFFHFFVQFYVNSAVTSLRIPNAVPTGKRIVVIFSLCLYLCIIPLYILYFSVVFCEIFVKKYIIFFHFLFNFYANSIRFKHAPNGCVPSGSTPTWWVFVFFCIYLLIMYITSICIVIFDTFYMIFCQKYVIFFIFFVQFLCEFYPLQTRA